jgi:hypothetical protein
MQILLSEFGTILVSRPAGKEAFLILQTRLSVLPKTEKIEINFTGVQALTPSWADEFVTPLLERYAERVILQNTENASVKATLEILQEQKTAQSKS